MRGKRTWPIWTADFLADLERRGQSVATRRLCRVQLAVFEAFCRQRNLAAGDLRGRHFHAFVHALTDWRGKRGRPFTAATQSMVAAAALKFLRWAFDTGRLPAAQARGLPGGRRRALPPVQASLWSAWRTDFINALRSRGLSRATLKIRTTWLRRLESWALSTGLSEPAAFTRHHLAYFLRVLNEPQPHLGRPWALHSQQQARATVRLFLRWAVRTGRLLVDPTVDCRLHHIPATSRPVPDAQDMKALLTLPSHTRYELRNQVVLELLYDTALRLSECVALDLMDVNLRDRSLRVRRGKGGAGRLVPVGEHLVMVLEPYLQHVRPRFQASLGQHALFLNNRGQRLGVQTVASLVRAAGQRVGMPQLQTHDLRRACATHLLAGGASLNDVARQLGHHDLAAVDRYVQVSPEALKAEHARSHPRSTREGTLS